MAGPEIVGTVAAIVQLVNYGASVHACITELAKKARNQSEILEELSEQVAGIIASAESIPPASSQASLTELNARRCIDKATALQTRLATWRREASSDGRMISKSRMLAAAAWRFREKEIANLWKDMRESMELLRFQASCKILEGKNLDSGMSTPSLSTSPYFNSLPINVYNAAQLLTRMDTTLPSRNPDFVGQEAFLRDLEQKRQLGNRIALVGLGGIGKTQLAIEYAHQFRKKSQGLCVLFTYASSALHLEQSYCKFAVDAQLTDPEASFTSKCQAVKSFLDSSQAVEWLMIIDGVDDEETFFGPGKLHNLLPERINGFIIFTTRSLQLALDLVRREEVIHLTHFGSQDSISLLHVRLGSQTNDPKDLLELADLLDGLPLALSQAASFITTSCDSVREYINLYHESETAKIDLLSEGRSHKDGSASNPVTKTWQISFARVKNENNLAAHLLCFAACLHRLRIPMDLLPRRENKVRFKAALGVLKNYFFIEMKPSEDTFDMQSLIHLTTRHWLRLEGQLEKYTELVLNSMYEHFPAEFQRRDQLVHGERLSTHARTVLSNPLSNENDQFSANLASRLSIYLRVNGEYSTALKYAQMAVKLSVVACGEHDHFTLTSQAELAILYRHLGRYEEAERLTKEVLRLREKILGPEHIETLASQNSLAIILHNQGKYAIAERLHKQILDVRERLLGPSHNDTMKSLNNLGLSLKRQEKYEEAKEVFQQVFIERDEILGRIDVGTLKVMNNLGLVLQLLKKYPEALGFHFAVLQGRKALFGPKHPDTLKSKLNIAAVLIDQERFAEAELETTEVVRGYEHLLGNDHPNTLYARSKLVTVLQGQGRYWEAKSTSQEVYDARRARLGEKHPETIASKKQLRNLVRFMSDHVELSQNNANAIPEMD